MKDLRILKMEKNNYNQEEKIFFSPGDVCTIRQNIPNKPTMVVFRVERSIIRNNGHDVLKGVRCRWFTKDGYLQEAVFSTKDLILI